MIDLRILLMYLCEDRVALDPIFYVGIVRHEMKDFPFAQYNCFKIILNDWDQQDITFYLISILNLSQRMLHLMLTSDLYMKPLQKMFMGIIDEKLRYYHLCHTFT